MIDWTQPVETTEDPPRPVRVLSPHGPDEHYPIVFALEGCRGIEIAKRNGEVLGEPPMYLRNVPPPKPEPVLREAWVVWDSDGMETVWTEEKDASDRARHFRGVYARAAVMSDGSPVPASPEQFDQMREMAKLIQERDGWRTKAEEALSLLRTANDRVEALQAEVDKRNESIQSMKPVVEAAIAWVIPEKRGLYAGDTHRLIDAVRAYQNAEPATSDSHEAVVEDALSPQKTAAEAVANVAAMMGPVKNCTTCSALSHNACCKKGMWSECCHSEYSEWEPRHD